MKRSIPTLTTTLGVALLLGGCGDPAGLTSPDPLGPDARGGAPLLSTTPAPGNGMRLISGSDVEISTDGGVTWSPAWVVGKHPNYAEPLGDSEWVGPVPNSSTAGFKGNTLWLARIEFTLPASRNRSLELVMFVDDWATARLNGQEVGAGGGFNGEATSFVFTDSAHFRTGSNTLVFEVANGQRRVNPTGLDFVATVHYETTLSVQVDVKPGSDRNPVQLRGRRAVIPVAVLTTRLADGDAVEFDAMEIDPGSVRFGPGEALEAHSRLHLEDVDGDGDMDAVFHFRAGDTGLACGDGTATLTGETRQGTRFRGSDAVMLRGC